MWCALIGAHSETTLIHKQEPRQEPEGSIACLSSIGQLHPTPKPLVEPLTIINIEPLPYAHTDMRLLASCLGAATLHLCCLSGSSVEADGKKVGDISPRVKDLVAKMVRKRCPLSRNRSVDFQWAACTIHLAGSDSFMRYICPHPPPCQSQSLKDKVGQMVRTNAAIRFDVGV